MQAKDIVDLLNELFEADPKAIESLFGIRVECGSRLLNHPLMLVREETTTSGGKCNTISVRGLINAIAGLDAMEIAGLYDPRNDNALAGFALKNGDGFGGEVLPASDHPNA